MYRNSTLHDKARVFDWQAVIARSASHPEEASYLSDPDKLNALHHICGRRPNLLVVRALIQADASQVEVVDVKGWTPLHYACRFKASPEVIKCLLETSPCFKSDGENAHTCRNSLSRNTAIRIQDKRGRCPLYYAIRYEADPEVIKLLVVAYPESITLKDKEGTSPISFIWDNFATGYVGRRHILEAINCLSDESTRKNYAMKEKLRVKWDRVIDILKVAWQHQKSSSNSDEQEREWLLLHAASSFSCHLSLLQLAVELCPEQANVVDVSTGRLPLHFVADCYSSGTENDTACRHMIRKLLKLYPDAAQCKDKMGMTPLRIAVEDKLWIGDGLVDLYNAFPGAAMIPDSAWMLPIHAAASSDYAHSCVVKSLLKHSPDGARAIDVEGKIPLHRAVVSASENYSKYEEIQRAYTDGAKCFDTKMNWLPLHAACASSDASPKLIQNLVDHFPGGVLARDKEGKTPFMLAAENGRYWDPVLKYLFDACPGVLKISDKYGFLPIHIIAMNAGSDVNSSHEDLEVLNTIFEIVKHDPSFV